MLQNANVEAIRLVFTYLIALVLIVGGLLILYQTRLDPPSSNSQNVALVVASMIGAAVQWVFAKDQASSTARQVERATLAGAKSASDVATAVAAK